MQPSRTFGLRHEGLVRETGVGPRAYRGGMSPASFRSSPPSIIERTDSSVMYLETPDDPDAISHGWDDLERRLGSLRGRRFLGTFRDGRYRVSVVLRDGDDPAALDLRTGTVSGGRYLRVRLRGNPDDIYARIPDEFTALEKTADRDDSRDPIESYRRLDEVDLLIPVKGAR